MSDIDAELDREEEAREPVRNERSLRARGRALSYGGDCRGNRVQQGASRMGVPLDLRESQLETGTKKCPHCGMTKPLSDFYRHRVHGFQEAYSWCKMCFIDDVKQRRLRKLGKLHE